MNARRIAPVLALLAGAAVAEPNPWYVGVAQSLIHDSNVLRLRDSQGVPPGGARSDTISITSLVAGVDQPIGRQRLYGSASLQALHYGNNDIYSGQGHRLLLGLDWATIERLSGNLEVSAHRRPRPDLRDIDGRLLVDGNEESARELRFKGAIGLVTRLSLEGALSWRDVGYSAASSRFREYRQDMASLGVRWRPAGATTFGIAARRTTTDYPQLPVGSVVGDERQRHDIDLTTTWEPAGASKLSARLSRGRTEHELDPRRDYSSTTGELGWDWKPGDKLQLALRAARDVGQDAEVYTNPLSRTTDSVRVRADYALTSKVSLDAGLTLYRRTLENTAGVTGDDGGHVLSVGATWSPLRNGTVGCSLAHDRRRDISNPVAFYNDAYTARTLSCFAQILLR